MVKLTNRQSGPAHNFEAYDDLAPTEMKPVLHTRETRVQWLLCEPCLFLKQVFCFLFSTKQNLLEELDGLQSDLTALKLKNEELKVSHHDYTQEVCIVF